MSARLQEIVAGPWEFHAQGDADEYCLLTCAGKWVIAFRINGEIMTAEQIAIAKLIAAAPDMRAALLIARRWMPKGLLNAAEEQEAAMVDAAIAKSEGMA